MHQYLRAEARGLQHPGIVSGPGAGERGSGHISSYRFLGEATRPASTPDMVEGRVRPVVVRSQRGITTSEVLGQHGPEPARGVFRRRQRSAGADYPVLSARSSPDRPEPVHRLLPGGRPIRHRAPVRAASTATHPRPCRCADRASPPLGVMSRSSSTASSTAANSGSTTDLARGRKLLLPLVPRHPADDSDDQAGPSGQDHEDAVRCFTRTEIFAIGFSG